mmetsp:Transcript_117505/g.269852  ORF Transcript_117505/g.269852 Transcript_117505/m.269852 type:complete len:105 (+) Transcript_117505:2-316(+)
MDAIAMEQPGKDEEQGGRPPDAGAGGDAGGARAESESVVTLAEFMTALTSGCDVDVGDLVTAFKDDREKAFLEKLFVLDVHKELEAARAKHELKVAKSRSSLET